MRQLRKKAGFTLVELSLSIAFIAVLSITIVLIINDAISTYRRGLTLNQINTTGMDLVDEIRATIQNSPAAAVTGRCDDIYDSKSGSSWATQKANCIKNGAQKFVVVERLANVDGVGKAPVFGAFCTGSYSYIWNSGYFDAGKVPGEAAGGVSKAEVKYMDESDDDSKTYSDFRLLKIQDKKRAVCINAVKSVSSSTYPMGDINIGNTFDISGSDKVMEEPVEVLNSDEANPLALYDFSAAAPASNGLNASFYSVSFILGTVQGGINVMSSGNFCAAPNDFESDSNFDYCAINKFNFAAQANGG